MTGKKRASKATWTDPDEAPELTDDWFAKADPYSGGKPCAPWRPPEGGGQHSPRSGRAGPFPQYWFGLAVAH
jgi:hypothetical protein